MDYVFTPQPLPSAVVAGLDERFPVRRIFCVGRNYAAHAREMGKDPDRDPPFFFTKPADALVGDQEQVAYPPETKDFQFEAELVVAIGRAGKDIQEQEAASFIYGYAVGNDLTRRDLQLGAREKGRPWDWGKAFDRSAVCGPIHRIASTGTIEKGSIALTVNGEMKQTADLSDLIWDVNEIISILSRSMKLLPGDLIYTGTPAGVGPLKPGDQCVVTIEGLGSVSTFVIAAEA